jgi:rRNA maturation endonuclease Nob1
MTVFDLLFLALLIPGLAIVALVVAVVLPRALRDDERLFHNQCLHCGYDLRDSPDRCPECGRSTEIQPPPPGSRE